MHALIIETDALIAMSIEDALREIGYRSFDFAATVAEAVAAAAQRPPDLVTSSLRLIEGTGIEAARLICAGREVPVVFVTTTGWVVRELSAAAVIVQKPFRHAALHHAVEQSRLGITLPPVKAERTPTARFRGRSAPLS
jgi:DNA-binding response OmpR family regulator